MVEQGCPVARACLCIQPLTPAFISQSLRGTRWGLTYTHCIWVQLTTDKYTGSQSPLLWRDPCVDDGPGTGEGAMASQPLYLLDMLSP